MTPAAILVLSLSLSADAFAAAIGLTTFACTTTGMLIGLGTLILPKYLGILPG